MNEEEKQEYKQSFMDKYNEIVGPKNLTREQEIKLLEKMIEHRRFLLMNMRNRPCIEGHEHSDSATRYDERSPWVCLSCGKEFASIYLLRNLVDENGNIITEENRNDK